MIAKIENGVVTEWPLGEHHIQTAHPNVSFGFPLTDDTLRDFSYARFKYSDPAQHDAEFQEAREVTPVLNGVVATQAWEIVEKYTADEKAAYIAKRDADRLEAAKVSARAQRDSLLAGSDWVVIRAYETNSNIPAEWELYRRALRDVPQQPGFPLDITWPAAPS